MLLMLLLKLRRPCLGLTRLEIQSLLHERGQEAQHLWIGGEDCRSIAGEIGRDASRDPVSSTSRDLFHPEDFLRETLPASEAREELLRDSEIHVLQMEKDERSSSFTTAALQKVIDLLLPGTRRRQVLQEEITVATEGVRPSLLFLPCSLLRLLLLLLFFL